MLFSLEVIALMPILIVTSGPQHGDIGSGIGAAGRKAKGITQYRVIFVNRWGGKSHEIGERSVQRHKSVRRDRARKGR